MSDDKTLSETLTNSAEALQRWNAIEPYATEVKGILDEYREIIDSVGSVFTAVDFVWNIYSNLEKAKENAAQQQAMAQQIIRAVDGIISRSMAEIKHHIDWTEVQAAVTAANSVQEGFSHDVLPYAKTFPLTGFDIGSLDILVSKARDVIVKLRDLVIARANIGDGAAIIILYQNMHAAVQCKLTLDKWRHGLIPAVIAEADSEMVGLNQLLGHVVPGLETMSNLSFSRGIVHFHAGGHGRPEFHRYSYFYKGKAQPVSGSNMAPVSQAFIEARKAERAKVIPQEVIQWKNYAWETWKQLHELKEKVPA
ncbi:hypothetical protein LTR06_011247 [Exophiala xenobiotica]|nr:hypothetical protein LTR06_011247 [Exophiala xenobiotica]